MKVLSIVGARPQFIKATLISKNFKSMRIKEILLHTGQHYDFNMSEIFFRELNLPEPDYQLCTGSDTHGGQTGKMIVEIEKILFHEKPDVVLVYGDTNTTLAGALASAKLHIPLAHVEAGLRSYDKRMPEEINRVLTDHCANILFCPTETAVINLQKEGFVNVINDGQLTDKSFNSQLIIDYPSRIVVNVGDVMFDVALKAKKCISKKNESEQILSKYFLKPKKYILTTIHRADNTDDREKMRNIMEALKQIARSEMKIFFSLHPRTKKALNESNLLTLLPKNLILNEPVCYTEMIALESNARLIITDSGGLQKEAYFFKIPCITARDETEWTELVNIGWNKVVGTKKTSIVSAVLASLSEDSEQKDWMEFYGDGKASDRIVEVLRNGGR